MALRKRARAKREGDEVSEGRAWKLFGLIPMKLLHRPRGTGSIGRDELACRAEHFLAGRWGLLISSAQECVLARKPVLEHNVQSEQERRGWAAQSRVQQGQVSRARHELTGAPLAPKNDETYRALQDRRPREQVRAIPEVVLDINPSQPLQLEMRTFVDCLRSAPACSAPGPPGGCSYEMLKVCLADPEVAQLLFMAAEDMARGTASEASRSFLVATMTAISKRDGGVRGIATGTAFRRLVSRTLARQFGAEVEKACAPSQFALSTPAGTDCVGHAIRAITDSHPLATVQSIDGIGAFDHVLRSAMLSKLMEVPQLQELIPFVRSVYARVRGKMSMASVGRWRSTREVNRRPAHASPVQSGSAHFSV